MVFCTASRVKRLVASLAAALVIVAEPARLPAQGGADRNAQYVVPRSRDFVLPTENKESAARHRSAYRIYLVGRDGRLQLGDAFEAADDAAAAARAVRLSEKGQAAELWAGGRIVGKVTKLGDFERGGS